MRAAGAVVFGKTNTPALASDCQTGEGNGTSSYAGGAGTPCRAASGSCSEHGGWWGAAY